MSFTAVLLPILAALGGAEQYMGLSTTWQAVNPLQEQLLKYLPEKEKQFAYLSAQELKTIASADVAVVNNFLKDNGFDIQLKPLKGDEPFAVAAILNILIEWTQQGRPTTLVHNNQEYPAVSMEKSFDVFYVHNYEHPILQLTAKNGDNVYMTIAQESLSSLELFTFIQDLSQRSRLKIETRSFYNNAIFPMVDLDQQTDINWLLKLGSKRISDKVLFDVRQAIMQTRFKMNEKGALAQSAAAIALARESYVVQPKGTLVINKPFYLWIERSGMSMPLFTAYIDTADWKKPADIKA